MTRFKGQGSRARVVLDGGPQARRHPGSQAHLSGYDPAVFRRRTGKRNPKVDYAESQFQIRIEMPLAFNLFDTEDIYAHYRNRSFRQAYNTQESALFLKDQSAGDLDYDLLSPRRSDIRLRGTKP